MSKKILVVDDSPATRAFLVSALEEIDGVEIVEAGNGYEALKALPQNAFNAIITDINMPEMNGLELVRFVKSNDMYKKIPIFIISTDHREADVKKGLSLGADWYFVKPIEMEQLKNTIEVFLGF